MGVLDTIAKFALPLRIAEIVLGIIVLGLMAAVESYFNFRGSPAFLLFCGIWGLIMGVALLVVQINGGTGGDANKSYLVAACDLITALFFFAGFIAMAADWFSCGGFSYYSEKFADYCRVGNAAIAMGAFSWVIWTITSIMTLPAAIAAAKGSSSSNNAPPPSNNPA